MYNVSHKISSSAFFSPHTDIFLWILGDILDKMITVVLGWTLVLKLLRQFLMEMFLSKYKLFIKAWIELLIFILIFNFSTTK